MHLPAHLLPTFAGSSLAALALALPLILGLVPRNAWYGVRTPAAMLGTEAEWYAINRRGGLILAAISIAILGVLAVLALLR